MNKKIVAAVLVALICAAGSVTAWGLSTRKVYTYSTDGIKVTVTGERNISFSPVPERSHDYTIKIKEDDFPFDRKLLERNFSVYIDGAGLDSSLVDVSIEADTVVVTISGENDKKTFTANINK